MAPHCEWPSTTTSRVPNRDGGELDAADLRRRDDVAGDADHEQIAEALIEDELGRHARVGAAEDDRERQLVLRQRRAPRLTQVAPRALPICGREAAVAVAQAFERFVCGDH